VVTVVTRQEPGCVGARAEHAPRWCSADRPEPRPAYYEAPEAYPGLPRRAWFRLARLMEHRGLLADGPALRLVRFLGDTDTVDEAGIIADVPAFITAYAARARASRQTAWTDLARLVGYGLVRQLQHSAPGYKARYRLSYPAALIDAEMPGLPPDIASALPHRKQAEADAQAGPEQGAGAAVPGDVGDLGHVPADSSCGGLDPSPYTREGNTPRHHRPRKPHRHRWRRSWGEDPTNEETAAAADVLRACRPRWVAQRGRQRVPGPGELADVEHLTALALRHAGPGELVLVLTQMVVSADDLPGVLAWRLSRIVAAAAQARRIDVDEDGTRTASVIAARAAVSSAPRSAGTTAVIAKARADAALATARLRGGLAPERRPRDHFALVAEQLADAHARPVIPPESPAAKRPAPAESLTRTCQ
jgi:hypothetical protein